MFGRSNDERSGVTWTTNNRLMTAFECFPDDVKADICQRLENLAGLGRAPTPDEVAAVFRGLLRSDLLILSRIYKSFDRSRLLTIAEYGESHPRYQEDRAGERYLDLYTLVMSDQYAEPAEPDACTEVVAQTFSDLLNREAAEMDSAESGAAEPTDDRPPAEPKPTHRRWHLPALASAAVFIICLFGYGWATAVQDYRAEGERNRQLELKATATARQLDGLRRFSEIIGRVQAELSDPRVRDPDIILEQVNELLDVADKKLKATQKLIRD